MRSTKIHLLAGLGLLFLLIATPAGAGTLRTWDNGGGDTDWTTPGNWNPDGYDISDNLIVSSGSPTSSSSVSIDNGGSITLAGPTTFVAFSNSLNIGYNDGEGTLTVMDGGAISNTDGYIGYEAVSTGVATVAGPGANP